jgi:hypothetical protein
MVPNTAEAVTVIQSICKFLSIHNKRKKHAAINAQNTTLDAKNTTAKINHFSTCHNAKMIKILKK